MGNHIKVGRNPPTALCEDGPFFNKERMLSFQFYMKPGIARAFPYSSEPTPQPFARRCGHYPGHRLHPVSAIGTIFKIGLTTSTDGA
jgi:hypothetical protein